MICDLFSGACCGVPCLVRCYNQTSPLPLNNLFAYSNENLIAVIATTGYSDEQLNAIVRLSKEPFLLAKYEWCCRLNMLAKRLSLIDDLILTL